jgi:hypothetical protein
LSVAGYSTSIAGLGNSSIRDTAAMSAGNATAAIQNEFPRAKKLEPVSNFGSQLHGVHPGIRNMSMLAARVDLTRSLQPQQS